MNYAIICDCIKLCSHIYVYIANSYKQLKSMNCAIKG